MKFFLIVVSSVFYLSCQIKGTNENVMLINDITNESVTATVDSFQSIIDSEIQNQFQSIKWLDNPDVLNLTDEDIVSLREYFEGFQDNPELIEELQGKSFYHTILACVLFESKYEGDLILYDVRSVFFQEDWIYYRKKNFDLSEIIFIENISSLMRLVNRTKKKFDVNNEYFMKMETLRLSDDELLKYFLYNSA